MMKRFFDRLTIFFFLLVLVGGGVWLSLSDAPLMIEEERRQAAPVPEASYEAFEKGEYIAALDAHFLDRLPCRRALLTLYAHTMQKGFANPRIGDIRVCETTLEKLPPAYDEALLLDNLDTIAHYLSAFLSGKEAYFSLIAHKGHYRGTDSIYTDAWRTIAEDGRFLPVDTAHTLAYDSYYRGDIHVRAECYRDFAVSLGQAMRFEPTAGLFPVDGREAKGTLAAQIPLGDYTDRFMLLYDANGVIASANVYRGESVSGLYRKEPFADPYDVYLGSEQESALLRIENPQCTSGRRLVLFRDSYARALVPYLVGAYSEIVVCDLRTPYRTLSDFSSLYADENTDVLVLVSTYTVLSTRF
ncbi:MAG: hypothetical protein IJW46_05755 [Clostridia bacterium]|nr:hypothetical protein [Clostridia bacterium]